MSKGQDEGEGEVIPDKQLTNKVHHHDNYSFFDETDLVSCCELVCMMYAKPMMSNDVSIRKNHNRMDLLLI
jgi:ArsR family metal-binding transcriptional regulator